MVQGYQSIVVLTGAGVSAESGIRTFRAADGLWEEHHVDDVATPEGYAADPVLVQRFYNERRRQLVGGEVQPNAAHQALARLEEEYSGELLLVTQNIDDLHERAGSRSLIHMHGELLKVRCEHCDRVTETRVNVTVDDRCAECKIGGLRPHVVWFGEMPLMMPKIEQALERCDLFAAIGTSGNVYPAAGYVRTANRAGAHTVQINLEPTAVNSDFDEIRLGPAGELVPAWVDEVLAH